MEAAKADTPAKPRRVGGPKPPAGHGRLIHLPRDLGPRPEVTAASADLLAAWRGLDPRITAVHPADQRDAPRAPQGRPGRRRRLGTPERGSPRRRGPSPGPSPIGSSRRLRRDDVPQRLQQRSVRVRNRHVASQRSRKGRRHVRLRQTTQRLILKQRTSVMCPGSFADNRARCWSRWKWSGEGR